MFPDNALMVCKSKSELRIVIGLCLFSFYYLQNCVFSSGFFLCDLQKVTMKCNEKTMIEASIIIGLLICTLKNQGLLQTLEKFQVMQTWIFFLGLHLKKATFIPKRGQILVLLICTLIFENQCLLQTLE